MKCHVSLVLWTYSLKMKANILTGLQYFLNLIEERQTSRAVRAQGPVLLPYLLHSSLKAISTIVSDRITRSWLPRLQLRLEYRRWLFSPTPGPRHATNSVYLHSGARAAWQSDGEMRNCDLFIVTRDLFILTRDLFILTRDLFILTKDLIVPNIRRPDVNRPAVTSCPATVKQIW